LPDEDGELFALLAERRSIKRQDESAPAEREENLRQICEAPAVTDAGVIAKLHLLMDATLDHGPRLSAIEQRQLLLAAITWLNHPRIRDDRVPMEVRALDTKELADALCSYAQEEAPAERVAGNAA
jgi:hypothetical protein